jgi:hypothetical protein
MNIAAVEGFPPARSESSNPSVRSGKFQTHPESGVAEEPAMPVSGTLSKEEKSVAKNVLLTQELPQDVVEVHQDPKSKDQIIIQYLDKAKDVVLQVPSQQELSVERGISRESQQAAKLRASESAAAAQSEGEQTHGNKL